MDFPEFYNNTALAFANYTGPLPDRPILQRRFSILEQQLPIDSPLLTFQAYTRDIFEYPWIFILPGVSVPLYLAMVFFLPYFIHKKRECKLAMQIWNFLLTLLSVAMFAVLSTSVFADMLNYSNPVYYVSCLPGGSLTVGLVPYAAIAFMFSKYLELVDTLFLILKKKEVIFLHWYHHATVLVYSWFSVILMYPPANIFGIVNSFVHCVMYSYYFIASFGVRPWWGKYVTRIQLAQMVVGILTTTSWAYYYYLSDLPCGFWSPLAKNLTVYNIPAESLLMISTLVMYVSYFILFLNLYLNRFGGANNTESKSANTTSSTSTNKRGQAAKKGQKAQEKKKNK